VIISLIQVLYDPRAPLPHHLDYEKVWEDIDFFAISPQIYHLLMQQGRLEQTPLFFQQQLKRKYDEALYLNIFIKNQMNQMLNQFEKLGIEVIPLKGIHFAEKYFGYMGARATTDIDLLVKKADIVKAIACVGALGYTMEQEQIPGHFHWSYSKQLPHCPVPMTVELHWDLLQITTSDLNISEFWEHSTPLEACSHVKELSDYHTFYMICLHGWRHNLNSLKYFIDILQLIHVLHGHLDFTRLFKDAAAHKTHRRMARTLAIVCRYFPHVASISHLPHNKRINLWWVYSGSRDTSYKTVKQYASWLYYEFCDYDTLPHCARALSAFNWHVLIKSKCLQAFTFFSAKRKKGVDRP
jgi:hypothetical protein